MTTKPIFAAPANAEGNAASVLREEMAAWDTPPLSVVFESRDEAISALCQKVFGAAPRYGSPTPPPPEKTFGEECLPRDILLLKISLQQCKNVAEERLMHADALYKALLPFLLLDDEWLRALPASIVRHIEDSKNTILSTGRVSPARSL
jgi:hypothetical protein